VVVETWERWRPDVEREGLRFVAAPEYHAFPTRERPLKPYQAVALATGVTRALIAAQRPDVVVADILTLAPALAAELEGVPWATLIPHVDPRGAPGFPPYSIGARLPRTAAGRRLWRLLDPLMARGLELGRVELNETRRRLGLAPLERVHGGISPALALVGTFPQLEYPRAVALPATHVVGPLRWEPPLAGTLDADVGDPAWPLVLVAPSTAQDPSQALLGAALAGLADLPVRVLAVASRGAAGGALPVPGNARRGAAGGALPVPGNARVVDWISYAQTMPRCAVVVCHAGHGTLAMALASGCPVVACPAAGDMNENAARVAWAGAGVRLPRRLVSPRGLRLAVQRALAEPALRARAGALAAWVAARDPADRAAELVEALAGHHDHTLRRTAPSGLDRVRRCEL
jgi:UDP:flavonoid glycosyltransferase YjiC (YdhE family)